MIGRLSNKISRNLENNNNEKVETPKKTTKKRKLDDSSSVTSTSSKKTKESKDEATKKKHKKIKRESGDGLEMTPIQHKNKLKMKKDKDGKKTSSSGSKSKSGTSSSKSGNTSTSSKSDAKSNSTSTSSTTAESSLYNNKTVYIEGLPFTATDEIVTEFFEVIHSVGAIKEVRLPRWHDSGRLRGYGHVEFVKESSVNKALDLTGKTYNNRVYDIGYRI